MLNTQPQMDSEMVEETTQPLTLEQKLQKLANHEIKIHSVSFGNFFQRALEETGATLKQLERFTEKKLVLGASQLPDVNYKVGCEWTATGKMEGYVWVGANNPITAARKLSNEDWDDFQETDHHDSYAEDIELEDSDFESLCRRFI